MNSVAGDLIALITMNLLPLTAPKSGTPGWSIANGTFGWTGGTVQDIDLNMKRDTIILASSKERRVSSLMPTPNTTGNSRLLPLL